ncbi:alpha/beta hydrolase [uncultured Sulfitobacter sp.]|uniref:alpha/beta hydrolase n=1 Tax=uncultured Sulfitobacter sp. TaxID=191468 RepID=UPI002618B981|nr:acetylxylan esterase [uncultured Sulfitobacter sp.]
MAGTDDAPIVYPALILPDTVERQCITLWARGVALDGDIYRPKSRAVDQKIPAVVLSHGIGGDKETTSRYAALFASSGMVALTFTHSSWGNSRGPLLPTGSKPEPHDAADHSVTAQEVRNLLDPLDWVDSFRAAIDYIEGEPGVDTARIGAWGTSYGGGTALYAAAVDKRIKALSVQVPAIFNLPEVFANKARQRAIQIARGEFDAIPQSQDQLPGLKGTPHFARMAQYHVGDMVDFVDVPCLILDAENEEMFDVTQSGGRAHAKLKERGVETCYEVLPNIDHYGIYFGGFERGSTLANDWFAKHL